MHHVQLFADLRSLRPVVLVLMLAVLVAWWLGASGKAFAAARFEFDLHERGKVIKNKFFMLNSWFYRPEWTTEPAAYPDDYFEINFPFIERVHLMTATGGSLQRDLFRNKWSSSVVDDYNFDELKLAIGQVLRQGLKPYIKTGNTPLKYSSRPRIGGFGVNVKPPDDYEVYYRYIRALAESMVETFGIDEVKTWWWGVLTEYENKDWFDAGDPESTKIAYFKLYDYTVAALEDALGPENVIVGAHSMSTIEGYWDEREFIEHVATGINYKTGKQGTQIDFLAVSYYDDTFVGLREASLLATVETVRQKALSVGLTDLMYGVDEGRVLNGWDGKPLTSRVVNLSGQAAADAKLFKLMVEHDIDWFATWGLTTERIWGGANAITTNLANLVYRMTGDETVGGRRVERSAHSWNDVDALVSFDAASSVLHVLVYNNSASPVAGEADTFELRVDHVRPVAGGVVTVERWRLDDDHGNWWPTWFRDQQARGLGDDAYDWSRYSVEVPRVLVRAEDREFWRSREPEYIRLGQLASEVFEIDVEGGSLVIKDEIGRQGVVFYEIRGVTVE